jgi:predicted ATPase/DNA-binding winged helix-turn-helix (wHTH) protein
MQNGVDPRNPTDVRFGRFELRPLERLLLCDGEPLVVGDRAFELLLVLVSQPGQLVRKNELLERVWPGRVVEENNLPVQVRALRKLLGEGVIANVPGYGYRFSARLELTDEAPVPPLSSAQPVAPAAPVAPLAPVVPVAPASAPAEPALGHRLYGRDADMALLTERLQHPGCLTLSGPSGVGKTSLAQALIQQARWAGQHCWVDLTTVSADAEVFAALCRAAGQQVPEAQAGASPEAQLARALPADTLVVLDNAEHVAAGVAALVGALRAAAPGWHLLVTTQVPLQVADEQVVPIGSLAVASDDMPVAQALADGAVGLLASRIRASGSRMPLDEAQLPLLRELCARLDGLPLALEMAAARVPLLGLRGVLDALDQRFALLKTRQRDVPERHRSLQAALDWSHGLLAPQEQRLFRWMGVFAGGCDIELMTAVAGEPGDSTWDVIDRLSVLVEHSLVAAEPTNPPAYRLPESMRAYAQVQLALSGETPQARLRHADALQARLTQAKLDVQQSRGGVRLVHYAPGLAVFDNVREAVRWCVVNAPARAVLLAVDMGFFVTFSELRAQALGLIVECEHLVDDPAVDLTADVRAYWLREMARHLLMRQSPDASAYARRACSLYRELNEDLDLFRALVALARSLTEPTDELGAVLAELEAVVARHPEWTDAQRLLALSTRASVLNVQQDWTALLAARLEELAMARRTGHLANAEAAESNVIFALNVLGRYEEAVARARAALAAEGGSDSASANAAYVRAGLVEALVGLGRFPEALHEAPAALALARRFGVLIVLGSLRQLLLLQARYPAAARWLGYLQRVHADAGATLTEDHRMPDRAARIGEAERCERATLGEAGWAAQLRQGSAMTDAQADALLFEKADQKATVSSNP